MTTTGFVKADGAELYFERRGSGPPLLMVAGGGCDCVEFPGGHSGAMEIPGAFATRLLGLFERL